MSCPPIPTLELNSFVQRLFERTDSGRLPLSGSIEVTSRCNLRCRHCYISHPAGDARSQASELTASQWAGVIDQAADEGCLRLLLTGGEPFLRPDFLAIYDHAKKRGMLVTVFTNGTLVTSKAADHLAEHPPAKIEISIYGSTAKTYEGVTDVPGSYRKCIEGIELILARGLPLVLKAALMTLNALDLEGMKAFASSLGVPFRYDPELNLRLEGGRDPASLRVPPEQVVAGDLADGIRMEEWGRFREHFLASSEQPSDRIYGCGAGTDSFHVDPEGELGLCMMARNPSFDLGKGTFRQGWADFLPRVLEEKWSGTASCRNCELNSLCSWCPGWSQVEHGDKESKVDYLCSITHLRDQAWMRYKEKGST
jgi:radical SAM protein with 4Fe4S-binding SPASM domain